MKVAKHFYNEMKLNLILQKRYWFEAVLAYLVLFGIFISIFFGFGSNFSEEKVASGELDVLLIGMVVWLFAVSCYSSASGDVTEAIRNKTLEQIYLSPNGLWYTLGVKALVSLTFAFATFFLVLYLFMLLTGNWVELDYWALLVSLILAAPSLAGIGYVVAGFNLVFKKASTFQSIIYFLLIGLITLDAFPINLFSYLPFALGSSIAKASVTMNVDLTAELIVFLSINSIIYFSAGILSFNFLEKYARKKGVLGHY